MSTLTEKSIRDAARIVWEYLVLGHEPASADAIVVVGGADLEVPRSAAKFFHQGIAPLCICSGGIAHQGDLLDPMWGRPEALVFRDVLLEERVPDSQILLEEHASNTGQNVALVRDLIRARGLSLRSIAYVTHPYSERRVLATHAVQWPEVPCRVLSGDRDMNRYVKGQKEFTRVINVLVGDLQRIEIYPAKGFSAPQIVPEHVAAAAKELRDAGFTKHLL